ncbi:MAG: FG-GAP repeat protein, partial [Planctomycetota bacterium]|nr:FG-GAP repeat protein [Planctomycetota bacterium]
MNARLMSLPLAVFALAVLASGASSQCELDKLTAIGAMVSDRFGVSVSLSGDTALVGARRNNGAGIYGSGSAYVFEKQGPVWVEVAKLTASDAAVGDNLGFSVSISGDTVLVGA